MNHFCDGNRDKLKEIVKVVNKFPRTSLEDIPKGLVNRVADTWTEAWEGAMDGDLIWGLLARIRSRCLLAPVPENEDRNSELKSRLLLWERGLFEDLILRIEAQRVQRVDRAKR